VNGKDDTEEKLDPIELTLLLIFEPGRVCVMIVVRIRAKQIYHGISPRNSESVAKPKSGEM
jgi:hypothetical protein